MTRARSDWVNFAMDSPRELLRFRHWDVGCSMGAVGEQGKFFQRRVRRRARLVW
jgi:hypothetical protein